MQDEQFPPELTAEDGKGTTGSVTQSLYGRIQTLSVPEKIKLATVGNREARNLLIRDSNRVVAQAVLESPRLTMEEVVSFAANKNLSGDIIRTLSEKKEFLKNYAVRCALVTNPKTPVATALRLLGTLREHDLKNISRDRNIPSVISRAALQELNRQSTRKG